MRSNDRIQPRPRTARDGFSLVELMITLVLLAIVVAVIATVLIGSERSKADTEGRLEAQQNGRSVSDIITQDLRTAGYDTDTDASPPQPPFAYVDSIEIIINANLGPNPAGQDTFLTRGYPRALNPGATPLPPRLSSTSWTPPMTYTTGAESIRYTLDLNNDGVVDAADQAVALASEAQRTSNPNDYVIARVTYGLLGGGTNGGSMEKVGLVRGPGAGIPAMYTVYLGTNSAPWDWHSGAIPANQLKNISRIVLKVTSEARRPRKDGTYPRATLTTEVNSLRNTPNASATLFQVSGYVFKDVNRNGTQDTGEPGVPGALMRLGTAGVSETSINGYYSISAAPAQYVLRQEVPTGYGPFSVDSLLVDFVSSPMDVTHSFADTAIAGGWLIDTCYVDTDVSGSRNAPDELVDGATVSANSTSQITNAFGCASIFLPPGNHSVMVTPPDSMGVTSTNPVTVTITDGMNTAIYTKLARTGTGKVNGYVFLDTNKNGVKDTGENVGIPNVWVGVTKNNGAAILAYAMTDASGYYEITAPNNMPAAVTPYEVVCIPGGGFYPTSAMQLSPIWLSVSQVISGQNFGMSNFTAITLIADRVLSLGVANLLEKDWSGSDNQYASKGAYDKDLILGSEYVSAPNVSVWWNDMNNTPLFASTYTYQRNAQSAALSIATGSIDGTAPAEREDVVTGLARKPGGNIAVWLNQNSSGNLGYLVTTPTLYQTNDAGDVNKCLLYDCGGTSALDLIVGTTNLANTGHLEVWIGNGSGAFARDEIYPPNGSLPAGLLGEVKAMLLTDVNADGIQDLIVGTKTGDGFGKIHVMRLNTRVAGARFVTVNSYDVVGEVTSMTLAYVDADAAIDLVVGTRVSSISGNVQYWKNLGSGAFALAGTFLADGPVLSLGTADMGGSAKNDIVFGYRLNESVYAGGIRILYLDLNALPPDDVDPAGGTQDFMAPAIALANFNFRLNSTTAGPYFVDMAVAMKPTSSTGKLLIFIR